MTKTTVEAQAVTVTDPKFLTVVDKPANKVGFKIVRNDTKGETMTKPVVVRRTKRSETNGIVRMEFPAAYTDEQVNGKLKEFGVNGFSVTRSDTGSVVASRSDLSTISKQRLAEITLGEIKTTIVRSEGNEAPTNPKSALTITSLVFRADKFTEAQVGEWLKANGMEGVSASTETDEGTVAYSVQRHEVPEGEEVREVTLEDGITARIMRSDCCDIPEGYVAIVNECAYGNWGWGQLDFAAYMADEVFSSESGSAIYTLKEVLRNILLYSSLPIADRKVLVTNALAQFEAYVQSLLDALPKTVLVAVQRSATPQLKENSDMTTQTQAPAQATTATTEDDKQPVTRGEIKALVTESVTAAVTAALASRQEPAATAASTTTASAAGGGDEQNTDEAKATASITRADVAAVVADAMKPLVEQVTKLSGVTVARTDAPETNVAQTKVEEPAKRGDFTGALFGNIARKK